MPQPFDFAGIPIDGAATAFIAAAAAERFRLPFVIVADQKEVKQEDVMGRGLLLWLLGIPIPIIILM